MSGLAWPLDEYRGVAPGGRDSDDPTGTAGSEALAGATTNKVSAGGFPLAHPFRATFTADPPAEHEGWQSEEP